MSHYMCPFFRWQTFVLFYFLAVMNNTALKFMYCTCFCVDIGFYYLLDTYRGVDLPGNMVTLCLTFWVTADFSKVAAPFCSLTSRVQGLPFSISPPTLVVGCLFYCSQPAERGYTQVGVLCDIQAYRPQHWAQWEATGNAYSFWL